MHCPLACLFLRHGALPLYLLGAPTRTNACHRPALPRTSNRCCTGCCLLVQRVCPFRTWAPRAPARRFAAGSWARRTHFYNLLPLPISPTRLPPFLPDMPTTRHRSLLLFYTARRSVSTCLPPVLSPAPSSLQNKARAYWKDSAAAYQRLCRLANLTAMPVDTIISI